MIPVILSAGRGSRVGTETKEFPKWFLKIGDQQLYEYQLSSLSTHFEKAYVVLGHGFGKRNRNPEEYIQHNEKICVEPLVCARWDQMENAGTAEFALSNIPINQDILLICGDTIFNEELLANFISTYSSKVQSEARSAVAMFEGVQNQKTAIRYDDDRKVTDYGAIRGHEEAGLFILHKDHIQRAKDIWARNKDEWFPIVFPNVMTEAIGVDRKNHIEINTRQDLMRAREICKGGENLIELIK